MGTPRAIVLRAAGINCDQESRAACEKVGFQTDVTHVNRLIENAKLVFDYQFLIVPGGFSFGDDLGAGKVLAKELKSRLGPEFRWIFYARQLMLGILSGFQILPKNGVLPQLIVTCAFHAHLPYN